MNGEIEAKNGTAKMQHLSATANEQGATRMKLAGEKHQVELLRK